MSSLDGAKRKTDAGAKGTQERRKHHNLREIFEQACWITAPFYDSTQVWGNASLTIYARQALREAYPSLSPQEIATLSASVERFHKAAQKK